MIDNTPPAQPSRSRYWLAGGCVVLAVGLIAGNGVGGLHAGIYILGAAACVLAGLGYRVFIVLGIVGLAASGILLTFDAENAAQKLGDVVFLSLAVGTALALVSREDAP